MHEADLNNIYKFSSYLKKYYVSISSINRLVSFMVITVVYSWKHTKHLNALLVAGNIRNIILNEVVHTNVLLNG
jgi:hypothetical protein